MNGGSDFKWATDVDERNLLWKTRHDILYACMALRPGCKVSFSVNPCMYRIQRNMQRMCSHTCILNPLLSGRLRSLG